MLLSRDILHGMVEMIEGTVNNPNWVPNQEFKEYFLNTCWGLVMDYKRKLEAKEREEE